MPKEALAIATSMKIVADMIEDTKFVETRLMQEVIIVNITVKNAIIALKENTLKTDIVKIIVAGSVIH
jgi:transcription initiation factor IIE alpha subunit